ncbi:hypothetical protein ACFL3M_03340 [Patescibacteria group bacterium]
MMKIQLMDDVAYNGTEKVPFKFWLAEFSQRLKIKSLAEKIDRFGLCESIFHKIEGYCEFLNSNCSRCSLSRYKISVLDGDNEKIISACHHHRASTAVFIIKGGYDTETAQLISAAQDEAIRRDGMRLGYYPSRD